MTEKTATTSGDKATASKTNAPEESAPTASGGELDGLCYSCGASISSKENACPHCGVGFDADSTGTHHVDHRNAYPARHRVAPDQLDRLAN